MFGLEDSIARGRAGSLPNGSCGVEHKHPTNYFISRSLGKIGLKTRVVVRYSRHLDTLVLADEATR